MAKKLKTVSNSDNKIINIIFIVLIVVFMLIIPFYRGLFFRINYIPAIIFTSAVFTVYSIYKIKDKTYKVLDTYMDVSVLLIPVAYLISFFFAVNAKDAFDMFLLYCSYFMLYKLTADLSSRNEKYKNLFINLIITSTFILSFTSMLHIAGIINIKGAFIGKRLFGLYQYANTSASVLGVGILLSLNKLIDEENNKLAAIYQLIMTALISSFIFTLSRGGYLVLAGVLLLNFFLVKARAKLKMLLYMFISFLSSMMLIYKYYTLAEEDISGIWIHYLISLVVSALIIYIVSYFKNLTRLKFTDKAINISLMAMALIFAGTAAFLFSVKEPIEYKIEHLVSYEESWEYKSINLYELESNSEYTIEFDVKASLESPNSYGIKIRSYDSANEYKEILKHFESVGSEFARKSFDFTTLEDTARVQILLYNYEADSYTIYKNVVIKDSNDITVKKMEKLKYVPAAIADRLADISLKTESVSLRTHFTKDGLNIIKDYPILGAGGGAWKNLYRQYQSIPYNTTEVHNFYVQYGTEVGIIGIVILTGLLVLVFLSMLRSIKAGSHCLHAYLAAMLLLLHSAIDFNLSLAAVGYILWMLIGIIGSEKNTLRLEQLPQKYVGIMAMVLALVILISTASINYGLKLGVQGAETAKNKKDMDKAIEIYKKASSLDRFNAAYHFDLAQLMTDQFLNTRDQKYYSEFEKRISLIKKYEPYNHQYTNTICNMLLALGKFGDASKMTEQKLLEEPMLAPSYMLRIDVNYQIASFYVKNKKVEEAIPYLEKVIETKDKLKEFNINLKEPLMLTEEYTKKVEAAFRTLEMIKADLGQ